MFEFPAVPIRPRDAAEPIRDAGGAPVASIGDFWRWAYSDVVTNTARGVLAEYLVALACGAERSVRDPWAPYDVLVQGDITVEVKSAAYLQSWAQRALSKITFSCAPRMMLNAELGTYAGEARRNCTVWVFALLAHEDQGTLDPLDVTQWTFWVVPNWWIDEVYPCARSVSMPQLVRSPYGEAVAWSGLAGRIEQVSAGTSPS